MFPPETKHLDLIKRTKVKSLYKGVDFHVLSKVKNYTRRNWYIRVCNLRY